MIRILVSAPLIATGQIVSTVGYALAGASHRNPHNREPYAPRRTYHLTGHGLSAKV